MRDDALRGSEEISRCSRYQDAEREREGEREREKEGERELLFGVSVGRAWARCDAQKSQGASGRNLYR